MAADVSVMTDPLIVYGMVGLLLGAVVLALLFSRPRRGLGAVKPSDVPEGAPADEPWMPTGDIFGDKGLDAAAPPALATTPPAAAAAPAPPSAVHEPRSTGAADETGAPPPWGRR
jgi:hypothetical protein